MDTDSTPVLPAQGPTRPRSEIETSHVSTLANARSQVAEVPKLWFQLTEPELRVMRRKRKKGHKWTPSAVTVAKELTSLGRGWLGYCAAKKIAEAEGRLSDFQARVHNDGSQDRPDEGAVSRETARTFTEANLIDQGIVLNEARRLKREAQSMSPSIENILRRHKIRPTSQTFSTNNANQGPHLKKRIIKPEHEPANTLEKEPRQRRFEIPNYDLKRRRKKASETPEELSPSPRDIYENLQPQFIPFLCEWKRCKAELHDIETLRKHVKIVHGRGGTYVCKWGKCRDDTIPAPSPFESKEEFLAHMDEEHLVPFTWHLGDGFRSDLKGVKKPDTEELPSYLFKDGIQVTPSIQDQKLEDFSTWRKNRQRLKQLLLQQMEKAPFEYDDEDDIPDLPPC